MKLSRSLSLSLALVLPLVVGCELGRAPELPPELKPFAEKPLTFSIFIAQAFPRGIDYERLNFNGARLDFECGRILAIPEGRNAPETDPLLDPRFKPYEKLQIEPGDLELAQLKRRFKKLSAVLPGAELPPADSVAKVREDGVFYLRYRYAEERRELATSARALAANSSSPALSEAAQLFNDARSLGGDKKCGFRSSAVIEGSGSAAEPRSIKETTADIYPQLARHKDAICLVWLENRKSKEGGELYFRILGQNGAPKGENKLIAQKVRAVSRPLPALEGFWLAWREESENPPLVRHAKITFRGVLEPIKAAVPDEYDDRVLEAGGANGRFVIALQQNDSMPSQLITAELTGE